MANSFTSGPDSIVGDGSAEMLIGGPGNDTLDGQGGDDTVLGQEGRDTVIVYQNATPRLSPSVNGGVFSGPFTLDGGADQDTVDFSRFFGRVIANLNVEIQSNPNSISQQGRILTDVFGPLESLKIDDFENMIGTESSDRLFGNNEDNRIEALAGDDTVHGFSGRNTLDGGAGTDTVLFTNRQTGVTVDLGAGTATNSETRTQLVNVENVTGSATQDRLTGDAGANLIQGADGDDTLDGAGGYDTLNGGRGDDLVIASPASSAQGGGVRVHAPGAQGSHFVSPIRAQGGLDFDTLDFSGLQGGIFVDLDLAAHKSARTGGQRGHLLSGEPGQIGARVYEVRLDDFEGIIGTRFDDALFGNNENNAIEGGTGNDTIHGFAGSDTLDGGAGTDLLMFTSTPGPVRADLLTGRSKDSTGQNQFSSFEGLGGSLHDDTLRGDAGNNSVSGNAGDDVIVATDGTDRLDGGDGFDAVVFSGLRAEFTIQQQGGQVQVSKPGQRASLTNVEVLLFDDRFEQLGDSSSSVLASFAPGANNTIQDGFAFNTKPFGQEGRLSVKLVDDVKMLGTDAEFDNLVGFYEITDIGGGIDLDGDGAADLMPEDDGYAKYAIESHVAELQLRAGSSGAAGRNTTAEQFGDVVLAGGRLYAPFVIANGGSLGFQGFLENERTERNRFFNDAADFSEDVVAYFSYVAANPDGAVHLKSLGNNMYGFEDMPSNISSDMDFNDAIFSFSFGTGAAFSEAEFSNSLLL